MLLVHLAYQNVQFGTVLGSILAYTRFAAGGFIFISGFSIGVIFLPRAQDPSRRAKTHLGLMRRALYILVVQYLSALGLLMLAVLRGGQIGTQGPWNALRQVLLLREGGDLLPFYVMMIAVSPFLLEMLRRRFGWVLVMMGSAGLFIWGLGHPWVLALAVHQNFPPVLWQMLFVFGLVCGAAWPKYQNVARGWKISMAIVAWAIFALLFVSEYSSDFGLPHLNLGLTFVKVPLSSGEALRYLSFILGILAATDLLWQWVQKIPGGGFVQTLGRKSLPVYVVHLWVVEAAGSLASSWWWMGRWQILLAPICLAILWGFALLTDLSIPLPRRRPDQWTVPVFNPRETALSAAQ